MEEKNARDLKACFCPWPLISFRIWNLHLPKTLPKHRVKKNNMLLENFSKLTSNPGPQILSVEKFPLSPSNSTPEAGEVPINLPIFQKLGNPQTQLPSPKKIGSTADRGENVQAHPLAWRSFQPRPPKCWGKLPIQPKTVET